MNDKMKLKIAKLAKANGKAYKKCGKEVVEAAEYSFIEGYAASFKNIFDFDCYSCGEKLTGGTLSAWKGVSKLEAKIKRLEKALKK